MASRRNLYWVLNVASDAEPVVIEAAYRALMKKYHPDQGHSISPNGTNAAEINAAFAVLRDPKRRAEYDDRERSRSQAVQLAQFQAALPLAREHSKVFGWGGWLVALTLAGALGLIASRTATMPPVIHLEAARAAALPDQDLRNPPPIQPVSPQELAQIRADAYAGREVKTVPSPPPAAVAPPAEAAPDVPDRPVDTPAVRHRTTRPSAAPYKDFIARHDGIY